MNINDLLRWCHLYQAFVIGDKQRLINIINNERKNQKQAFESYLTAQIDSKRIADLLKKSMYQDDDYLTAYSQLLALDKKFGDSINAINKLDSHFFNKKYPIISLHNTRYLLASAEQHPIVKAIPKKSRYKLNEEIGNDRLLHLQYQWIPIGRSEQISWLRCNIFDSLAVESTSKLTVLVYRPLPALKICSGIMETIIFGVQVLKMNQNFGTELFKF